MRDDIKEDANEVQAKNDDDERRQDLETLERGRADEELASPDEFKELWKRWFQATTGAKTVEENAFLNATSTLWSEMAEDISAKMLAEEGLPRDPLRFFLRWYEDTGEKWSKAADEHLKKDEVLESMARSLEDYARSYEKLHHASEESLKNLGLPARSDTTRVAQLVRGVEDKVDRLEEVFEEFIYGDSEPATAGAVGDLEERMDRLEGKMDQMLAALEKLSTGEDPGEPAAAKEQ